MLAIRLQRTGRKGHPMYRFIVQEAHRQPTSGRVVAQLGSYNPHSKEVVLDKEKAEAFLKNGAQPSDRVVRLFQLQKVTLPTWVQKLVTDKQKAIKNLEKLRRNQSKEEVVAEAETPAEETPAAEAAADEATTEEAAAPDAELAEASVEPEETAEAPANEAKAESVAEESSEEAPAEKDNTKKT